MKLKTNYGMVVSGHKEATKAGTKILKTGGNQSGKEWAENKIGRAHV